MNAQDKYQLITRDLAEVVDQASLKELLAKKDPVIYWGTAPTGMPHLGYFVPMFKIADFLASGATVKILFANMHAYLDNMKSTWELLEYRTQLYTIVIKSMLIHIGVPITKLQFVTGTDFQLKKEYTLDMYKLSALSTTKDAQKAGAEVVKQVEHPRMSGLLYPTLQALDEVYLDADIQFGGVDQRKIFMYAREFLPKIGYSKRVHLMNQLIPGLGESGKMSSSEPNSKIDFLDSDEAIAKKISKAHCVDGVVEGNGILALTKWIIFRRASTFVIPRPEKYGGSITFNSYAEVEDAFAHKKLASVDLKAGVTKELQVFLAPLRKTLEAHADLLKKAYP